MFSVRKVNTEAIEVIQQLAQSIWPVSYKDMISKEQIDYMLNLMYSHDALQNQMTTLSHQFILLYNNEAPVGFAAYSPKIAHEHSLYRLHKLYVLPEMQGKGAGKCLLDFIVNEITSLGAAQLDLNVNRKNPAFHFYIKNGFTILKEEDLYIGDGYFMNDYIMIKELNESYAPSKTS